MSLYRLDYCGPKKIAAIKLVRDAYGFDLMKSKAFVESAPCVLPQEVKPGISYETLIKEFSEIGAKLTNLDPSPIDRMAAAQFIASAQDALGEGEVEKTVEDLKSAIKLLTGL